MPDIMRLVIAWTCVGVFIATAVITLLALVRVIVLAEKKYLDRLFKLLVAEIVVICVAFFGNWLRAPEKVQQDIETRTADKVSTETVRVMNDRYAPMVAEYQQSPKNPFQMLAPLCHARHGRRSLRHAGEERPGGVRWSDGPPRRHRSPCNDYLDCGIFDRSLARVRCKRCREEYLLALSCKGEGFARRAPRSAARPSAPSWPTRSSKT